MAQTFRYYGIAGHVNAESPIIKVPSSAALTFSAGTLVAANATGKAVKLSNAASLTSIIGLVEFEQELKANEDLEIRELTPNVMLETIAVDANARVIGVQLDLENDLDFAASSVNHVIMARTSTASEKTIFRLLPAALEAW